MPHNVPLSSDVFDVMHTMRAMRRLKPDPVPDELIFKILAAGQAAASGGNSQQWKFLVLKDPAKKKAVQVYYKKLFDEVVGPRYASSPTPPGVNPESFKRQHSAVEAACVQGLEAARHRTRPQRCPRPQRSSQSLGPAAGPDFLEFEQIAEQPSGALGDQDGVRRGHPL
jgi:nitroreductase